MGEYKIILKDGTTLEDAHAGLADGFLWLWIPGVTILDVAGFVFDPDKMDEIRFQHGGSEEIYEGYTSCLHINTRTDEIAVCMVRG